MNIHIEMDFHHVRVQLIEGNITGKYLAVAILL